MTQSYNEFLEKSHKNLDMKVLSIYQEYSNGGAEEEYLENNDELDEDFILYENTEDWFEDIFKCYGGTGNIGDVINVDYKVLRGVHSYKFRKQLIEDFVPELIDVNDYEEVFDDEIDLLDCSPEQLLKFNRREHCNLMLRNERATINYKFVANYVEDILTFERFKNILYENGEYNEVFADENTLELK